ncbi:MAG: MFS transporter [Alphaproteobacteria bacterium]|nr:MFS transporter [Alphaproteobacteria bacterium]
MTELAETTSAGIAAARPRAPSIESRGSWIAAGVTLALLSVSYGSPLLVVVGLKPITADLGTPRQMVALAGALTWLGTGAGGILMGWLAERTSIRFTVILGTVMIALGLAVSASGNIWAILIGHTLLVGLLGNGALYPPLLVYVSRWFDRRRGTALALISSGQYIAGMAWPILFERAMTDYGWRATMVGWAVVMLVTIPPLAFFFLHRPPEVPTSFFRDGTADERRAVLGLRPNVVLAIIAIAGFCCCIPMSIPQGHLVAFCSDIGIPAAQGAAMLSVLQASAFTSRMFWGWLSDRIGGLKTVLLGSACQAVAIAAFMATQDEAGLFAVSAAYGLGFSGIIPAYVVAIRDLFPAREASWRVPTVLFVSMGGMAFGGWFAGALYDHFGFYAPAFMTGVIFNIANLGLVGFLVMRQRWSGGLRPYPA